MNFELNGKVVIITGGAGLLGQAFAAAVASVGGIPVLADIDQEKMNSAKSIIEKQTGGTVETLLLDITSETQVSAAAQALFDKHGGIHALVNNAYPRNASYGAKFEDVTYDSFCDNVSRHIGGYFLCSRIFSSHFLAQGAGKIVNIGSVYGVVAPRFEIYDETDMNMPIEYSVIKAGVIHLTRYMTRYFKGHNIQVNCISPGGIKNSQPASFVEKYSRYSAVSGLLNPQDVSGTLLFLLSPLASALNGQNIVVDHGWSL